MGNPMLRPERTVFTFCVALMLAPALAHDPKNPDGFIDVDDINIRIFQEQKINLRIPQEALFYLSFKNAADAAKAGKETEQLGFKQKGIYREGDNIYLSVSKSLIVNKENLGKIHDQLILVAERCSGIYRLDLWNLV